MSFEFTGLQYDGTRKVTTTQTFKTQTVGIATAIRKTYMPVPYNMSFELSIFTKLNDDMLQIVEQILPYFQPAYTLSVNLVDTIGEKRDIPIVIENITMQDDYEGNYSTRRSLLYTIRFTAKTYLFQTCWRYFKGIQRSYQKSSNWICSRRFFYTNQRSYLYCCSQSNTKLYR